MLDRKNTPIAVIGAGSWGTALALLLAKNGFHVRLWGHEKKDMAAMQKNRVNQHYLPGFHFPDNIEVESEMSQALTDVDDVLIVVPSHAFRNVLINAKTYFHEKTRLVWGTKGLDADSCQTLDEVAREILSDKTPLAVLSGPSFACEVAEGLPTAVTVATNNDAFANDLIERFCNSTFRLYKSRDMKGVELCGVVKNVMAIAVGMSDGLKMGANARSALMTRGLAELARLLTAVNADPKTLMSLAGVGDMILTCSTGLSRNRRFGLALGEGMSSRDAIKKIGQVVEGYTNAQQLHRLSQQNNVDMPIIQAVYHVLYENLPIQQAAKQLLARETSGRWG